MVNELLLREFNYFLEHQDELVAKHGGKVIVLKDQTVIGVFDDEFEAARETAKTEEPGTFLVQRCDAGPDCYTVAFQGHGVSFAPAQACPDARQKGRSSPHRRAGIPIGGASRASGVCLCPRLAQTRGYMDRLSPQSCA